MKDDQRPGNSGVFRAIVDSARKLTRAVTGSGEQALDPRATVLGEKIAQAFVAGRFEDVHKMGTPGFQERLGRAQFVERWRDAVKERGTLTGFEISDAGPIDLGFVPGLEEVPQSQFLGFVQIAFSDPQTSLEDERAFTLGAVLVAYEGLPLLGALHKS